MPAHPLRSLTIVLFLLVSLPSAPALADDPDTLTLPAAVAKHAPVPLSKVGQGTYRKFGFAVYNAALWAPEGFWEAEEPFALQLSYTRSLSKETLIDAVMDDIENQNIADETTRARWRDFLEASLRDVEDGDVLAGLSLPAENEAILFLNGAVIAVIDEQAFSDAFFSIWLGTNADADLREALLGEARVAQLTPQEP